MPYPILVQEVACAVRVLSMSCSFTSLGVLALAHAISCGVLLSPDQTWDNVYVRARWILQTLISKRAGLYRSKNELRAANSRLVKGLQVMDKRLNPQNTKVRRT